MISNMIPVPGVVHDFVLRIMARHRNSTCRLKSESFSSGLDFASKICTSVFSGQLMLPYTVVYIADSFDVSRGRIKNHKWATSAKEWPTHSSPPKEKKKKKKIRLYCNSEMRTKFE